MSKKRHLQMLTDVLDDLGAEEGFTQELLDSVDLSIAYSPVLAIRGEGLNKAVDAIPTVGGKYIVKHPLFCQAVDTELLKRMRLRWLLARDAAMRVQYGQIFAEYTGKERR